MNRTGQTERCVMQPLSEPITVANLLLHLEQDAYADAGLAAAQTEKLSEVIAAARATCEDYTRRVFCTQRWIFSRAGFPWRDGSYSREGYLDMPLSKPPLQAVEFVQYVDPSGTMQQLAADTTNGMGANLPPYGYKLVPGGETQPARILPRYASWWPSTQGTKGSVQVQVRCGYGGLVPFTVAQGSAVVTSKFYFLPVDVGAAVILPGAGASGGAYNSTIASVDGNGVATLATAVQTAVVGVQVYLGDPIPQALVQAVRFTAMFYERQGADTDQPLPSVVTRLLNPYMNRVA